MIVGIKGMNDYLDEQAALYEHVVRTASAVAERFGYSFIACPHVEQKALFCRSVGDSSDIVGKEMYEFKDRGGDEICLRPEGTAGVVRAYIERKMDRAGAVKRWFYHGSMFRYEKPQRGRYREFHQFGVECFGVPSAAEDAAIIIMLAQIFAELGIKARLVINSLGEKADLERYRAALREFAAPFASELCSDCARRYESNIIRVLDCKNDSCAAKFAAAPRLADFLSEAAAADFAQVCALLDAAGLAYEIEHTLVRGLDYYCKTAFEFISDEIGAKAAIAGGGRYDYLVEYLGGRASSGVGFAMGIERVMDILSSKKSEQKAQNDAIYLGVLDENLCQKAFVLANSLRKSHRKIVQCYEAKKLAKHLSAADKLGCEKALIIGSEEAANEAVMLKNLKNSTSEIIKIKDIEKWL